MAGVGLPPGIGQMLVDFDIGAPIPEEWLVSISVRVAVRMWEGVGTVVVLVLVRMWVG